jgi:two-component system, sensor histidine kinase and response regulator
MASEASGMARILVIDDERGIREGCRRVLQAEGYHAETAENGEAGLRAVEAGKFDLLLVDVKMPGMSGIELVRRVREVDPSLVCVMITGYATLETAVEATRSGAYDFLPKPFTPDELLAKVGKGLDRHWLELEARRLREERERNLLAKSQFIAMVAHELSSPLAAIRGYMDLLLGDAPLEEGARRQMMERSRDRAASMLDLIDDLLDVAAIEAGQVTRTAESVEASALLQEAVDLVRDQAAADGIAVDLERPQLLPAVHGNREDLLRVFANLLSNAVKYNRKGGSVHVSARVQGGQVRIEVRDTGIGIPAECLPKVFDEFYRVKRAETRHIPGTGLGLSIVKKIVEAHLGSISVDSAPGVGSTFTLLLPVAQPSR